MKNAPATRPARRIPAARLARLRAANAANHQAREDAWQARQDAAEHPSIARSGIAARSRGRSGDSGVYCMPILASFTLTHQWVRELRRWHPGVLVAVHVRLSDCLLYTSPSPRDTR